MTSGGTNQEPKSRRENSPGMTVLSFEARAVLAPLLSPAPGGSLPALNVICVRSTPATSALFLRSENVEDPPPPSLARSYDRRP